MLRRSNDQSQAVSLIAFSGIAFSLETPAVLNPGSASALASQARPVVFSVAQ